MCPEKSKTLHSDSSERLAKLAYETTVSPSRYDELIAAWDTHIRRLLLPDGAKPQASELDPALSRHFGRALRVFESIGREHELSESLLSAQQIVDTQQVCALAFDTQNNLVAANTAARTLFGLPDSLNQTSLPLGSPARADLSAALVLVRESGRPQPLIIRDSADRPLVLLASIAHPTGLIIANAAHGQWSEATEHLLKQGFTITATELAVIRGLYDGLSLKQIAERRSRSIGTVRTQLKTILQKTGAHSQLELMRLVTGLVFASNSIQEAHNLTNEDTQQFTPAQSQEPISTAIWQTGRAAVLQLRNGRHLAYEDLGPQESTSIAVFVHGMLDNPRLPLAFAEALQRSNVRCLCIERPGYGNSDPVKEGENLAERFAADLEEFLDVLNLKKVNLIGHLSGGISACICAALLPGRITRVVNINSGVPIVSRQQIDIMLPRQRVIALTARYAPKALPLILRAGVALLDSGGERKFMRSLHRDSPRDHKLTQRADVFAQIKASYKYVVNQGFAAFQSESALVTSNWDHYLQDVGCPVTFIHGVHDGVVAISTVREFCARHPGIELLECPQFGQLMFYGHPAEIGALVVSALGLAQSPVSAS